MDDGPADTLTESEEGRDASYLQDSFLFETSEEAVFKYGTFAFHACATFLSPWSPLLALCYGENARMEVFLRSLITRSSLTDQVIDAFMRVAVPLILTASVYAFFSFPMYPGFTADAVVSWTFLVVQSILCGITFAMVTTREYNKLHQSDSERSQHLMRSIRVDSTWSGAPPHDVMLCEIELCALANGVDLAGTWLALRSDEADVANVGVGADVEHEKSERILKRYLSSLSAVPLVFRLYPDFAMMAQRQSALFHDEPPAWVANTVFDERAEIHAEHEKSASGEDSDGSGVHVTPLHMFSRKDTSVFFQEDAPSTDRPVPVPALPSAASLPVAPPYNALTVVTSSRQMSDRGALARAARQTSQNASAPGGRGSFDRPRPAPIAPMSLPRPSALNRSGRYSRRVRRGRPSMDISIGSEGDVSKPSTTAAGRRMRADMKKVSKSFKMGRTVVSGGQLVAALVQRSYERTQKLLSSAKVIGQTIALAQGMTSAAMRGVQGQTPFGSTVPQAAFFILLFVVKTAAFSYVARILVASGVDCVRRAICLRELGELIRVTPSIQQPDDPSTADTRAKRVLARAPHIFGNNRKIWPKAEKADRIKFLPLLDMHEQATVQGWLSVRLVVLNYGLRITARMQTYVTLLVIWTTGLLAWQMVFIYTEQHTHYMFFEVVALACVSGTCLIACAVAGADCNGEHATHSRHLYKHRLMLHTSEEGVTKTNARTDALLSVGADMVGNAERYSVIGFEATPDLAKAITSGILTIIGTVLVAVFRVAFHNLSA